MRTERAKRRRFAQVLAHALAAALTLGVATAHAAVADDPGFRADLALRYAPIHQQAVHTQGGHALGGAADYITRFDFDGDDDARNNWEHAGEARFPLAAYAYYSVVETQSHWFVTYMFFHPRDWSSTFFETEHENDSEGLMLVVARDGTKLGALRAAVTVAHSDFYSYVPAGSEWTSGAEDVDGQLLLEDFEGAPHPLTCQQAETHALKAWPQYRIEAQGVVYYPSRDRAEVPKSPNDRHVSYQLLDVLAPGGLWAARDNPRVFARPGTFAGDAGGGCGKGAFACHQNAANAPWGWNDRDDPSPRGALARDPSGLARAYFQPHEWVSHRYLFNPFSITVPLTNVARGRVRPPHGPTL
jgi:hypothetical protein